MNKIKSILICLLFPTSILAANVPISLFSLKNYSQDINKWLKHSNYNKRVMSVDYQQYRLKEFYNHLYSTDGTNASSPWSGKYVNKLFRQQPNLTTLEKNLVLWFSNKDKDPAHIGYGENFRPHTLQWINNIKENMNINQFSNLTYNANSRAIAIANLNARVLPTDSPHFYNFTLPGQGYPFDNLQMSSLWAGTPVYIVAQSRDKAWDFVITPSFIAWVHSKYIARVNNNFINDWSRTAIKKMAAIIHTKTPIIDENGKFQFYAYVGSVFPLLKNKNCQLTILIPELGKDGLGEIHNAIVKKNDIAQMPLPATPHEFAKVIQSLLNRPYGWGGYNFYNDCSQELKSLFSPFAIWLPRHSSNQVYAGRMVDKSNLKLSQRLNYLMGSGHSLTTVIYLGGHIILYIGNYPNPYHPTDLMAMTYQNLWGLSPISRDRRSIIGESVLFPMLKQYPEDPSLNSLANGKYFQISFLDEWPSALKVSRFINLKSLVYPEYMTNN